MILMRTNLDCLDFLTGSCELLQNMQMTPVLSAFSKQAVEFLAALSQKLLADRTVKSHVDIMSYAYWIRKASLLQARDKHRDRNCRIGRGVAFHITPSNVPVNFAVSMTSSLLAGNATAIRVSDKKFVQVDLICKVINELLDDGYEDMRPYICIFRYIHDDAVTAELSSMCDIRVIWGGDQTIARIRRAPLPSRAIELTFADRHSLAIIDAEAYLKTDAAEVAKGFYTDTYYTDQNACSSPRMVVWHGNEQEVAKAKRIFWEHLQELVDRDYDMKPIQAVDKYSLFCRLAMKSKSVALDSSANNLVRIKVQKLTAGLMDDKGSGGYFFEYQTENLNEIVPVLTKPCQTVSVLGINKEEIKKIVFENGVRGVDRIVPLGQTMGLEFIWDGFKMIEAMTRFVYTGEYE